MSKKADDYRPQTCLVCGVKDTPAQPHKRGLCGSDYFKFIRAKAKASELGLDVERFEENLMLNGKLLPDARLSSNPFIEALNQLVAETHENYETLDTPLPNIEADQRMVKDEPVKAARSVRQKRSDVPKRKNKSG